MLKMRAVLLLASFVLGACGGGGGSSNNASAPDPVANVPPSVNAGPDDDARALTTITLMGSVSDSDGTIQSLLWEQVSGPAIALTAVDQSSLDVQLPDLDCPTVFQFRLSATDNDGDSSEDTLALAVQPNIPPYVVDPGPNRKLFTGNNITIEPEIDLQDCLIQSAQWTQIEGTPIPVSQTGADLIVDGSGIDEDENLSLRLTVTDIEGGSASEDIIIFARTPNRVELSQELQPDAFKLFADADRVFAKVSTTLLDINGLTGDVRTIAGNTIDVSDSGGQTDSFSSLRDARYDADREVVYLAQSQLDVIDTDPNDGSTAIESILPQSEILGCCNDLAFEFSADSIYSIQSENDQSDLYAYSRSGSGTPTLVTSLPNDDLALFRTDVAFYAYGGSSASQLITIDLNTGFWSALVSVPSTGRTPSMPANSETHVYWQVDDVLYEIEEQTQNVQIVATGLLPVVELTYHNGFVYGVQRPSFSSPEEVRRTNVNTGVSEVVSSLSRIDGLGFANDTLYLVAGRRSPTATDIYRVDGGTPTVVTSLADTQFQGNNAGRTMTLVGERLYIANSFGGFLIFNVADLSVEHLITPSPTEYVAELDGFIVFGGGRTNNGLSGFDATKRLRKESNVYNTGRQSNTWSLVDSANTIYWIYSEQETPGFSEIFKIGAIGKDGTGFQTLFSGSSNEIRDIGLYNDTLVFACLDECGASGWQLASLPVSGGVPDLLDSLGEDPKLYLANNLVYILSGPLGSGLTVFNLDTQESEVLPINLAGRDFNLVAREDVIYVGDRDELKRYEKGAWDEIIQEQTISVSDREFPENFDFGSMSLTETALYYRDVTLTRLSDVAP
jgi:K319-like protein